MTNLWVQASVLHLPQSIAANLWKKATKTSNIFLHFCIVFFFKTSIPKKVITLFIFFKSIFYTAYTQTDNNSFLYVFTTNESAKPLANGKSNNSELNSILELYNVTK